MIEKLDYIDKYFNGQLSPEEKVSFEKQCETDQEFAEEIAFYISARAEVKTALYQQKKNEFREQYQQISSSKLQKPQSGIIRRMAPYFAAAAACLVIFFCWQFFFNTTSTQHLADGYIEREMLNPGVLMGTSQDSLESGITAMKNKNYDQAESIFKALSNQPAESSESIKNLGTLYLVTGRYNQALEQFERLAGLKNLHANRGILYQAITLMERNNKGDKEKAKSLLEEVIQKDLDGKKEAEIWIDKL